MLTRATFGSQALSFTHVITIQTRQVMSYFFSLSETATFTKSDKKTKRELKK